MKNRIKIILFCISIIAFVGCDRTTKNIAKDHLKNKGTISWFHDTFRLEYAENTGAAMNLGDGLSKIASYWLLSIVPLLFLLIMFGYTLKNFGRMSNEKLICYSLIIAGGLGNIIDRLQFERHVTDFMNFGIRDFRTGIFNFADLYITMGVVWILFSFMGKKQKSTTAI